MPPLHISGACLRSAAAFGVRLVEALRHGFARRCRSSSAEKNDCVRRAGDAGRATRLQGSGWNRQGVCAVSACWPFGQMGLSVQAFCKKSGQGAVPIEHAATISQAVEALKALPVTVSSLPLRHPVLH